MRLGTEQRASVVSMAMEQNDADMESRRTAARIRLARIRLLNNIALVNGLIIGFVALSIGYEILGQDLRAIAALYYFDLGSDLYPGFARAAISLDLLARLPTDLIHGYEALVPTNPVFYKACTSGVAYTLGDFVSQVFQGRDLKSLDLARSARSGAAGFIGHGPLCHYWMVFMETYLDFDGAWWATGFKVIADQTVWSLYLNAMYSFFIGALAFRSPAVVWDDIKTTSWPALKTSWRFWPFVHCISFSHAVPLDLKLLWVDVMEIVWVTLLSRVANKDAEEGVEEVAVVGGDGFGVDPALEITLSEIVEVEGRDVLDRNVVGAGTRDTSAEEGGPLDNSLLREAKEVVKAFNPQNLPPPSQLLNNAWPLAALWPLLYAFYQGELALGLQV